MKSKIETDYNWGSWNLLAWKKGRHFVMPPLVSPQIKKDVLVRKKRRDDVLMTCHYLDLGSASDWLKQIFLSVITEAYASCYHQWLLCFMYLLFPLFPLVPLVPPLSPCSPCSFVPLAPSCPPLFPLVPPCSHCPSLFLLFPLFPLFPLDLPCSLVPFVTPCTLLYPLSPFVPLVPPCSPVPLVHLQFTTLNVWQSQISVNEKKRSRFKRNPLKSRIPNHKHVTKKVLHLIWWR